MTPCENSRLKLRIVGLDSRDELPRLELAFLRRNFLVRQATLVVMSNNYVDQTWELVLKSDDSTISEMFMSPFRNYSQRTTLGSTNPNDPQLEVRKVSAKSVLQALPSAEAAVTGVQEVLQVSLRAVSQVGVRVGMADAVRRNGYRMCCGLLRAQGSDRLADKLWLLPAGSRSLAECDDNKMEDLRVTLTEAVQRSLKEGLGFDEKAARREAESGAPDSHEFQTPPRAFAVTKADELVGILKEADQAKNLLKMKQLPRALHQALKKLEYSVNGPTSVGLQIPGFSKYTGIGLAERTNALGYDSPEDGGDDGGMPLVVELRTLYIKDEPDKVDMAQRLKSMMKIEKGYAEFVSWLDVQKRTWTIYMVFLNEVLPSGRGYGHTAVAEHLLAPPELFFHANKADKKEDRSLMNSLLDSIPDLEMIRICDVVNWNTYMLVAIAASPSRSCSEVFGEHMEWVLKQELQQSRMPMEILKQGTVLEVLKYTCLGKLVVQALADFNKKRGAKLEMVSANVVKSSGYEIINGESRARLNVEIKLQSQLDVRKEASGHIRRLKSHLTNLHIMDTMGARDAGQVMEGLEGLTAPSVTDALVSPTRAPTPYTQGTDEGTKGARIARVDVGDIFEPGPFDRSYTIPDNDISMLTELVKMVGGSEPSRRRASSNGTMPARSGTPPVTADLQPIAAVVVKMCAVLSQLQKERGTSCLAIAQAACPEEDGDGPSTPSATIQAKLRAQRKRTDNTFSAVLGALKLAAKCKLKGKVGQMCSEGSEVFQMVSVKAMLQRPIIEAACSEPPDKWMHRYLVVCCGDTGYHKLIGTVTSWIIKAIDMMAQEMVDGAQKRRYQILVVLTEHLGQHRSFFAAKGSSRLREEAIGKQTWDTLNAGAQQIQQFLRSASADRSELLKNLAELLKDLTAMQVMVQQEANDPTYSIPRKEILKLFDRLTTFIDEVDALVQDELEESIEALPGGFCFPTTDYASEMEGGYATDGQVGGINSPEVLQVVEELKADRYEKVVVLAGAGISVSANLPDFRSPGGLYDQMRKQGISTPESVFTTDFVTECPDIFYKVMKQLKTEDVNPTPTHCFLRLLQNRGLLQRCCTQNIDCLERKVGIKPDNLVEAHGTLGSVRCMKCRKAHPKHCLFDPKESDGIPRCSECKGFLRPDIVFFGEELNWNAPNVHADLASADLVIIMGTSMVVHPFAGIVNNVKNSCAVLVVNRVMPKSLASQRRRKAMTSKLLGREPLRKEAFLQGNCDDSIRWLAQELGWAEELEEMLSIAPWRQKKDEFQI